MHNLTLLLFLFITLHFIKILDTPKTLLKNHY